MNDSYYTLYGDPQLEEFMSMFFGTLVVGLAIGFVIFGVFFILQAVGMMGIAKKRGINNPWLGFIPIASDYMLGNIADNIDRGHGKKSYSRVILPILSVITLISGGLLYVWYFRFIFSFIQMAVYGIEPSPAQFFSEMIPGLVFMGILLLFAITEMVLTCIIIHKIGKEYAPQSATAYLILTIFFNIYAMSIILFSLRNKEPWYMQSQPAPYPIQPAAPQQMPTQNTPPSE